jgi:hypothetical protein
MPYTFDASQLPRVRVVFHGDIRLADMAGYERELGLLLGRDQDFGMLLRVRDAGAIEPRVVPTHAAFLDRNRARCAKRWLGLALVFESAAARFLMTSMLLLTKLPMPYRICDKGEDGEAWLEERVSSGR